MGVDVSLCFLGLQRTYDYWSTAGQVVHHFYCETCGDDGYINSSARSLVSDQYVKQDLDRSVYDSFQRGLHCER